jgi:hypothetical protein
MNDIQPFDTIFYLSRTYFFSDPGNLFALYIQENYSEAIFLSQRLDRGFLSGLIIPNL